MAKKQLVLVVEGTAALGRYWPTILYDYLNNIIRSFCDTGSSSDADTSNVELAFVVYNARGPSSSTWLLNQTDWTSDLDCFFKWLSTIEFTADTFSEVAIAEGLTQALMICRSSNGSQNDGLHSHCILVAASDPDSPDAEKVAKSFPQSCVSLSVICPLHRPKLRAIYNAGKRNPSVADPTINTKKNLHYIGLISENLIEAGAALNPSENFQIVTSSGKSSVTSIAGPNSVKVWEGDLYGVRPGQPAVLITRLEAYLSSSASKSLAKDWPSCIQIVCVSRSSTDNMLKRYVKESHFVVFHAMNYHELLGNLQQHKLCGVIKLPSQILLFTITNNPSCFLGMLFRVPPEQQELFFKKWMGQEI